MVFKISFLKDKIAVAALVLFVGFAVFDLLSGANFRIDLSYFIILSVLFFGVSFSYEEKIFRIIALILFSIVIYFYFQSSFAAFSCRSYSDYHCLAKKAIKKKDISFCERYKGRKSTEEEYRQYCFEEASTGWIDISLCDKIEDRLHSSKYRCIANVAVNNNDKKLCERINFVPAGYSPNKESCYKKFEEKP